MNVEAIGYVAEKYKRLFSRIGTLGGRTEVTEMGEGGSRNKGEKERKKMVDRTTLCAESYSSTRVS